MPVQRLTPPKSAFDLNYPPLAPFNLPRPATIAKPSVCGGEKKCFLITSAFLFFRLLFLLLDDHGRMHHSFKWKETAPEAKAFLNIIHIQASIVFFFCGLKKSRF